jgi:hypothetical protein
MIYLLSILFTIAFVYYTKWQFKSSRTGKWHNYGLIMRLLAITSPFIGQFFKISWQDLLLASSINIILWDVLINRIALKVKWSYVGFTSKLDVYLGKRKWVLYLILLITTLIIKAYSNQIDNFVLKLVNYVVL